MKTWFTADPHYGHENIIKYCKRPFTTVEEMDEKLIDNYNSVVKPEDTVYILGDIALRNSAEYLRRLNGRKFLLRGNHDKYIDECRSQVGWIRDLTQINVLGQKITLCHYALRVWPSSHHGAFHCYGHSHGTLPDDPNSLSLDVGVDCHGYFPISFEQIKDLMAKKKFKPVDHHKMNNEECKLQFEAITATNAWLEAETRKYKSSKPRNKLKLKELQARHVQLLKDINKMIYRMEE